MKDKFLLTCSECGIQEMEKWSRNCLEELLRYQLCFNCNFWMEKVRWREQNNPSAVVTPTYHHFFVGPEDKKIRFRGHSGNLFIIFFDDGRRVETTNLWYQGVVPERFRERLSPNAHFGTRIE